MFSSDFIFNSVLSCHSCRALPSLPHLRHVPDQPHLLLMDNQWGYLYHWLGATRCQTVCARPPVQHSEYCLIAVFFWPRLLSTWLCWDAPVLNLTAWLFFFFFFVSDDKTAWSPFCLRGIKSWLLFHYPSQKCRLPSSHHIRQSVSILADCFSVVTWSNHSVEILMHPSLDCSLSPRKKKDRSQAVNIRRLKGIFGTEAAFWSTRTPRAEPE